MTESLAEPRRGHAGSAHPDGHRRALARVRDRDLPGASSLRAGQSIAAHARLPDRRRRRPAQCGRPQLGSRHDGADRRAGPRRARRGSRRGLAWRSRSTRSATVAVVVALLAMRNLRPYVPPAVQTGFRRSVRVTLSFVRRSRRVAVAFFVVLALSIFSFNFDVLLPLAGRADPGCRRGRLRPDRGRLRRRSPLRCALPRHARQGEPSA